MPLDPLIARLIKMTYRSGFDQLHTQSIEEVRKRVKTHHSAPQPGFYDDYILENDCHLRIFRPAAEKPTSPLPLVYYVRGCGGIAPEPVEANDYCALLSKKLNAYVAAMSFRLAPEFKFPIGLYDGMMGIKWIHANHLKLNVHPDGIVAWGESSGASALTVCCHLLKQENNPIIKHQTLLYPMVDMHNDYPSKSKYAKGYLLDVSFLDWLFEQYLSSPEERQDIRVSPLLNPDLTDLPPTTIITAEYDPIRDEGEAYAERLAAAGNQVVLKRFDGVTHGFVVYQKRLKKGAEALDFACNKLLQFFAQTVS
jgi:acetyl esterase